jgi:uncharacterized protein YmfQ (DUF2313 family)
MSDATETEAVGSARYRGMLQRLLPRGLVWNLEPDSVLGRLLEGHGAEHWRVEQRGLALLREADPRTTVEMLEDWERVVGLPDPCTGALEGLAQRRAAIAARLGALGAQTPAFYVSLAAALGYTITITEFDMFTVGMTVGLPLNGLAWQVNAPATTVSFATVGQSVAGDPLATWGNLLLECVLERAKPAHTVVLFSYS